MRELTTFQLEFILQQTADALKKYLFVNVHNMTEIGKMELKDEQNQLGVLKTIVRHEIQLRKQAQCKPPIV